MAGSGGAAGASGAGAGGTIAGAGSGGAGGAGGCGTQSFAAIYQDIFASPTYMCNGPVCHGKMAGQTGSVGNLELITKEAAYADLVGVASDGVLCGGTATRVVPGDAAGSLLVQKLRAMTVQCGSVMPVSGAPITDPELMRITDWINAGACNN
jgi:hypothetical protein